MLHVTQTTCSHSPSATTSVLTSDWSRHFIQSSTHLQLSLNQTENYRWQQIVNRFNSRRCGILFSVGHVIQIKSALFHLQIWKLHKNYFNACGWILKLGLKILVILRFYVHRVICEALLSEQNYLTPFRFRVTTVLKFEETATHIVFVDKLNMHNLGIPKLENDLNFQ